MGNEAKKRVVFISTYPPRKCGIATFTADLIRSVTATEGAPLEPLVVTMRSDDGSKYSDPVKFEIRQNVRRDYICAADYINFSHVDLVSVQHEFGLFGGQGGDYLSLLLKRLKAPIITTLHTVLDNPAPAYRQAMTDLCERSDTVVTMNAYGVDMLGSIYGIDAGKIKLIPHGIPDLPFVDSNYYKHKFGLEGRRTILTFGLMSKNKGIEVMLEAMPEIVRAEPNVMYIVLGMTHPGVLKHEGESYRFGLQQRVKDLRLQDHVIFHNRFVDDPELHNFLCAADVYVTPYLNREQLTSGTLAFAVGTGKAVVSTPYWAAEELLADGRGRLVPFGDSKELARHVVEILTNDSLFYSLRRAAYDYGRSRTWPKTGQSYAELFGQAAPVHIAPRAALIPAETVSSIEVPEPSLDHLAKLTDDTGLYQHATFTIPNRAHGYCTDDNARGIIVMTKYYSQYHNAQALRLLDTYLSFLMYSQRPDGSVRNFMDFDRSWWENEPAHDALGRVLWALGALTANPPSPAHLSIVKDCFDRSVGLVQKQHPRGMAYAILGMCDYLTRFPGASDIKRDLELAAEGLLKQYKENTYPDWDWFEDILTYDNAVLPQALFEAGRSLDHAECIDVAEKTTDFLLANTFDGDHFSFIGCQGWYERRGTRACFDQQPIEAAGTVMMLKAAFDATGNARFPPLQRRAFDWFLGANDLRIPLYDFTTKGCSDGLMAGGTNGNQGAESTLSFMLGLLTILENDAIAHQTLEPESTDSDGLVINTCERIAQAPVSTEDAGAPEDNVAQDRISKST